MSDTEVNSGDGAVAPEVLWRPSDDTVAGSNLTRYTAWLGRRPRHDVRGVRRPVALVGRGSRRLLVVDLVVLRGVRPCSVPGGRARHLGRGRRVVPGGASELRRAPAARPPAPPTRSWPARRPGRRSPSAGTSCATPWPVVGPDSQRLGVARGDRVVAYLPNIPEAVVAFLATASLGAIWASCPPEFGPRSVLDRFGQLDPAVLVTVGGYRYGDKDVDRSAEVAEIRAGLPTLNHVVEVAYGGPAVPDVAGLGRAVSASPVRSRSTRSPFDHPLYVLFSSGTTGLPKAIVHGHGGILLEHLKALGLHQDLGPDDRFFWFTTTGWMMWNYMVSALALGSAVVLFDGDPGAPDLTELWRVAGSTGTTVFGVSAPFLMACRKAGVEPASVAPRPAVDRIDGRTAAGGGLPVGVRAVPRHVPHLDQRGHRRVHRVRRGRADAAGRGRRDELSSARHEGRGLGPRRDQPGGHRGRAGRHRADAVDARRVLERPRRESLPRRLLLHVPGGVVPRRLAHRHRPGDLHHHRAFRRHAQPGRGAPRHQRVLRGGRGPPGGGRQPRRAPRRARRPRAPRPVRRAHAGGGAQRRAGGGDP